ncbi:MAG: YbaB/EbfC family nucleoid-associated protein [Gammaproteobacteria bacterium CG11_big_fil_rev_8_21_14_0_20_46_22]|nr:MAG: YbaB/EbfC family nucleoid-associated protein [Gammaproteobacteria bacterium CG12_big_fil_rev_8_21_14_0_65_46_12]PIR10881.1 MAG: YbaB/EbfC family nucleoid-associated protein [Gammaproteobacteria bacterium CG11_big_fil_rev_8_21_14_0_20_46_22]
MSTPDFNQLMEQAKEMQEKMKSVQGKITSIQVVGEAGGGMVKVTLNGAHQCKRVEISPTLIGEEDDIDMLEDLVAAAINDASQKIEAITKDEMVKMAKDMKLPEGFEGLGDDEGGQF